MKKNLQSIIIYLLMFFLFACVSGKKKETTIIEGDLYFDFLRYGSFYNVPDSTVNKFKVYVDTVSREKLNKFDKELIYIYETLIRENLLYSPFIDLKINDDSIIKFYMNKKDYSEIKKHKVKELQNNTKKIIIKAEVKILGERMVFCEKLISAKRKNGRTHQHGGGKLKIEDYN